MDIFSHQINYAHPLGQREMAIQYGPHVASHTFQQGTMDFAAEVDDYHHRGS